ncbi:hypothetical protein F2Q70_00020942 [Brassica cretica]|uniref:DUF4283 domain-containing protein n=1 Tax=Brassica cretica TaxID=69181 RepID=A0A8S9HPL4_BRACR|nr:hypothetical protein F2Q70_00020942 [Brassica cretica]KAF2558502.1 hypothetical protein F2Q68_00014407 [Brassica cretica]
MAGVSEPPLVPPVHPDLMFLMPHVTDVQMPSSPQNFSAHVESPSGNQIGPSSNPSGGVPSNGETSQGSEFNWLSRAKATRKFQKSTIPITRSEEGVPRVKIPNAMFERGAKAHSDYIVDRRVTIHNLSNNAYIFYIPSVALRQCILQHELWRVGDSPFFVAEWKAAFSIDPPSLNFAPIWVTLSKVPFDLLTDEGLEIISKPLGRIVDAKPFSSVSSVDGKVVVDLTVRLPETSEIERENGLVDVLEVSYSWLPSLCPICNEIGHKANFCHTRKPQHKDQGQTVSRNFYRVQKSSKKVKEKSKVWVSNKQVVKETHSQEQTVPVKSCMNSVLSDLGLTTRVANVGGKTPVRNRATRYPCVDPGPSELLKNRDKLGVCVKYGRVTLLGQKCGNYAGSVERHQTGPIRHGLLISPPESGTVEEAPDSLIEADISQRENPFIPAVNTKLPKSVVGGLQENHTVVSLNPFAILGQEDEPQSHCKEVSNLSLVVSTPVNGQSSSPQYLSKSAKNKKRKLAKRSPVSGVKILPPEALPFFLTAVYASNEVEDLRELWTSLKDTTIAFDLSTHLWMVCGDFNEILDPQESSNPSIITSTRPMRELGDNPHLARGEKT